MIDDGLKLIRKPSMDIFIVKRKLPGDKLLSADAGLFNRCEKPIAGVSPLLAECPLPPETFVPL